MAEEHVKVVLKRQQIVNGKHYSEGAHSVPAKIAEQLRARKDVLEEVPPEAAPENAAPDMTENSAKKKRAES